MGFNHGLGLAADNIGVELFEVVAHYFIPLSIGIGYSERVVKRSQEFFLVYSENILLIVFLLLAINVNSRADTARDVVSCNALVALLNALNIDDVFGFFICGCVF